MRRPMSQSQRSRNMLRNAMVLMFLFAASFFVALHTSAANSVPPLSRRPPLARLAALPPKSNSGTPVDLMRSPTKQADVFAAPPALPNQAAGSFSEKPRRSPANLSNCPWIESLLRGEDPNASSAGLPQSGKPTDFGAIFWLKQPILKTVDPNTGAKVVLLKYNHYTETQHIIKFTNTISVLQEFRNTGIFPDLRAFCKGASDGFDYIVVDYVPLHPSELPAVRNFGDCFERAIKVINLLVVLDEDLHLAFVDVKPGQWMAREGGKDFVLQDMDDIVHPPWVGEQYPDQVEDAIRRVARVMGVSFRRAHRAWHTEMFPRQQLTIRYAMVRLDQMLINDMGFRWESQTCRSGMPQGFLTCLHQVVDWGAHAGSDWPSPMQIKDALVQCRDNKGVFQKSQRERAAWRDLAPDSDKYEAPGYCKRPLGSRQLGMGAAKWCSDQDGRACCAEYKGEICGVQVDDSLCGA